MNNKLTWEKYLNDNLNIQGENPIIAIKDYVR